MEYTKQIHAKDREIDGLKKRVAKVCGMCAREEGVLQKPLGEVCQEPITRRSFQLSIIATEHVQSNISNPTVPLFGNFYITRASLR